MSARREFGWKQAVDAGLLDEVIRIGVQTARDSGEGEAISRWCAALDPGYRERLVRHVADLLALAGPPPERFVLVDAGGGSGLLSAIGCVLGASKAIVVDTNRHLMEFLQAAIPRMPAGVTLEGRLRDVADTGLPDGCADVVLCNEALSHMLDIDAFMEEARRLLATSGRLVISDSNNAANPRVRRARVAEWAKFERILDGKGEAGELFIKRRDLIMANLEKVGVQRANELAANTFGLTGPQVLEAARVALSLGKMPASRFDGHRCPVDPLSNQCTDRLFSPKALRAQFSAHGMTARVRAHFATRSPYRALNGVWGAMSPMTLPFSGAFRVVAERRENV